MVSATDVITYIGVPLAVLGVLPILYTFASALYTRQKIQRSLRKNDVTGASIRTRLMTGVVEVDLPIYELQPTSRDDDLYWLQAKPKSDAVGAPSWTQLYWSDIVVGSITGRLQRSDRIRLPEARIQFKQLIDLLQDRGAQMCYEGWHVLHERGRQTPVGTRLMELDYESPILCVAKPGGSGSISLQIYAEPLSREKRLSPSYIVGPLDDLDSKSSKNPSAKASSLPTEQGQLFVIKIFDSALEYIGITDSVASNLDHGEPLEDLHHRQIAGSYGDLTRFVFPSAAIAIFSYRNRAYVDFQLDGQMVSVIHDFSIKVQDAAFLGLLDNEGSSIPLMGNKTPPNTCYLDTSDDKQATVKRSPSRDYSAILAGNEDLKHALSKLEEFKHRPKVIGRSFNLASEQ